MLCVTYARRELMEINTVLLVEKDFIPAMVNAYRSAQDKPSHTIPKHALNAHLNVLRALIFMIIRA